MTSIWDSGARWSRTSTASTRAISSGSTTAAKPRFGCSMARAPVSGAAVGPNVGPSWHLMGDGDFNADGRSDFLWQDNSGQAAVWLMNGHEPDLRHHGRPEPRPIMARDRLRPLRWRRQRRYSVAGQQWPSRDLADEWNEPDRRRSGRVQSWPVLACDRFRRFQRRLPQRHSLAERQRPGRDLADERDEPDRRRRDRAQPRPVLTCLFVAPALFRPLQTRLVLRRGGLRAGYLPALRATLRREARRQNGVVLVRNVGRAGLKR